MIKELLIVAIVKEIREERERDLNHNFMSFYF